MNSAWDDLERERAPRLKWIPVVLCIEWLPIHTLESHPRALGVGDLRPAYVLTRKDQRCEFDQPFAVQRPDRACIEQLVIEPRMREQLECAAAEGLDSAYGCKRRLALMQHPAVGHHARWEGREGVERALKGGPIAFRRLVSRVAGCSFACLCFLHVSGDARDQSRVYPEEGCTFVLDDAHKVQRSSRAAIPAQTGRERVVPGRLPPERAKGGVARTSGKEQKRRSALSAGAASSPCRPPAKPAGESLGHRASRAVASDDDDEVQPIAVLDVFRDRADDVLIVETRVQNLKRSEVCPRGREHVVGVERTAVAGGRIKRDQGMFIRLRQAEGEGLEPPTPAMPVLRPQRAAALPTLPPLQL